MSGQALNLVTSARILWRHKILAAALILLGVVGAAAYAWAQPDVYTSTATVMLSPGVNLSGEAVAATSVPVLSDALRTGRLPLSLKTLQSRVKDAPAGEPGIVITAEGPTAQEAERTANAVARSYLTYITSPSSPSGQQAATLLRQAATASAKPRTTRVYQAAGIGFLAGALVALIAILAIGRSDRRLRTRDDIADLVGVPVLASIHVSSPKDAAGWMKILARSEPEAAEAWQLRRALQGLDVLTDPGHSGGFSGAVLSLSCDESALALGPQLAAFAAAQGISTALVIGQLREMKAAVALRTACAASAGRPPNDLLVLQAEHGHAAEASTQTMTLAVEVVDAKAPRVADMPRAKAAVLAVSGGVVAAEQLARVVASAAGAGIEIVGALMVNPDPGDQTTGGLPQLARSEQQTTPTRTTAVITGRRR